MLAVLAASKLVLTSCANNETSTTPTSETVTTTAQQNAMGTMVDGHEASLKIVDAWTSDHYERIVDISPGEKRENVHARDTGQIVIVKSEVVNKGAKEMDLICSFGLQVAHFKDKGSEYTPVDKVYEIPGNPECNAKLGTDFDDEMTWVFEIPTSHTPEKIGFTNPENHFDEFTFIVLDKLGKKPKEGAETSTTPSTSPTTVSTDSNNAPDEAPRSSRTYQEQQAPVTDTAGTRTASSPAYGATCSSSQLLQPGTGPNGESLICAGMGANAPARWLFGPAPSGQTVTNGQTRTDGESGGQDPNGRMLMCVGGERVYGS